MIFDPEHKVLTYDQAEKKALEIRKKGEKIIMMSGVFDLFHMAHVMILTKAKNLGGIVFVSLGSDETVRTIKGPTRPIITEDLRAGTLAALEVVDYVVIAKEKVQMPSRIDFEILMSKIKPHIFALGNDDKSIEEKTRLANKHGAELVLIDRSDHGFISSTEIEEKIKSSLKKEKRS